MAIAPFLPAGVLSAPLSFDQPKPSWRASLLDRFMPDSGLSGQQKDALARQGLLQAGLAMLQTGGGFGNALGAGLQSGLLAMNRGQQDIRDDRRNDQLMDIRQQQLAQGREAPAQQRYVQWLTSQLPESERADAVRYFAGLGSRPLQDSVSQEVVETANGPMVLEKSRLGGSRLIPMGGATPQGAVSSIDDIWSRLQSQFPGTSITSTTRTPERNRQVGGVANSRHLDGGAADFAVPPQARNQFAQAARAAGLEVVDGYRNPHGTGPHMHVELPNGVSARPLSKAEQAAAEAAAKRRVELSTLPAELDMRTQAALGQAQGEAQIAAGAEMAKEQKSNNRALAQYEAAMSGVREGMQGTATGPLAGRLPALTSSQQIAEGAVAAIAPTLKQLFRSAGEGTFTDKDQELLLAMVPTRIDTPEAREWKMNNIDNIVRARLSAASANQAKPSGGDPLGIL